jgi:hypothetical protein
MDMNHKPLMYEGADAGLRREGLRSLRDGAASRSARRAEGGLEAA